MIDLKKKIEKDLRSVEKQIKQATKERDESATPMESQHDQTRQIANQLYNSLLEERKKLGEMMFIADKFNSVVTILNVSTGMPQKYFIVPNGLGGTSEGDIILLSEKTPLAKTLSGRKPGSEFELNGQKLRIVKIEENV